MSTSARGRSLVVLAVAALLATSVVACTSRRMVTGWTPSWANDPAVSSLDLADDLFGEVSPFWFNVTGATTITPLLAAPEMAKVLDVARKAHLPVVPSLADATAPRAMAAVLVDPVQRKAHVDAIVSFVLTGGYDGVDLDYERFAFADGRDTWPVTRPAWVAFVQQLAAALHERGRLLTVAIPPTYDAAQGPSSGYWVYDYAGIAPHVDRVRIMGYDYSVSSPGPIGPQWWVDQILAYAVTKIPPSKLQIGVPAYGRNWVAQVTGTCPTGTELRTVTVLAKDGAALAAAKNVAPVRDQASGELTFTYTETFTGPAPPPPTTAPVTTTTLPPTAPGAPLPALAPAAPAPSGATTTCTVRRTVWYPDMVSMLARTKLVGKYGISGIAQWAVGFEDQAQWPEIRSYAATLPHPAGVDPIGKLEGVTVGRGTITVKGWTLDPETDLPLHIVIRADGRSWDALANLARADVATAHSGAGIFHGFQRTLSVPPVRTVVCVSVVGVGAGAPSVSLGCANVTVPA